MAWARFRSSAASTPPVDLRRRVTRNVYGQEVVFQLKGQKNPDRYGTLSMLRRRPERSQEERELRRVLVVLSVVLVALLPALPASAQPAAAPVSINVGDKWFCDSSFEGEVCSTNISPGTTVTWTNIGTKDHTVTQCTDATFSNCSGFDSGSLASSETFEQTVASGTIYYRCDFHAEEMRGQLNVSAAPAPTPTPTPAPTPTQPPPPPPPPPSGGGASTGGGTSTSGEAGTSGGATAGEQPSPTAQPSGEDPSPTPSPGGRTAAVTQVTPTSDVGTAQARRDDSGGGSSFWLYALVGIGGGLALLGGGTFAFRRYRHRLFRRD